MESFQHIGGVTASADRERNVTFIDERGELFGKDIVVTRVICPSGHQGNVVGEGQHAEAPVPVNHRALAEVAGGMGSQSSAATVTEYIDGFALEVRVPQGVRHAIDQGKRKPSKNGTDALEVHRSEERRVGKECRSRW